MTVETARYRISPSNESVLALELLKTGLQRGKKHILFFERYQGEIDCKLAKHEVSSMRFAIEAASAICRDDWLKPSERAKVRAMALNDILAADRYPQLTFSSTEAVSRGAKSFEIRGALDMRGVEKPLAIEVAITSLGEDRLEIDGTAGISQRAYDLKPHSSMLGLVRTKDRMILRLLLWAEKPQA